jgi:hypothetical protein
LFRQAPLFVADASPKLILKYFTQPAQTLTSFMTRVSRAANL